MAVKASVQERGFHCIKFSFLACDGPKVAACRRTTPFRDCERREKGQLDQECGVKDLQIGRRRLNKRHPGPIGKRLSESRKKVRWNNGNHTQINVKID